MHYDCQATQETLAEYGVEKVETRYLDQPVRYGDHIGKWFAHTTRELSKGQALSFFKASGLLGESLMDEQAWLDALERSFPDSIRPWYKLRREEGGWELTITEPRPDKETRNKKKFPTGEHAIQLTSAVKVTLAYKDAPHAITFPMRDATVYDDEWHYLCEEDGPGGLGFIVQGSCDDGRPMADASLYVAVFEDMFDDDPSAILGRGEIGFEELPTPR